MNTQTNKAAYTKYAFISSAIVIGWFITLASGGLTVSRDTPNCALWKDQVEMDICYQYNQKHKA